MCICTPCCGIVIGSANYITSKRDVQDQLPLGKCVHPDTLMEALRKEVTWCRSPILCQLHKLKLSDMHVYTPGRGTFTGTARRAALGHVCPCIDGAAM